MICPFCNSSLPKTPHNSQNCKICNINICYQQITESYVKPFSISSFLLNNSFRYHELQLPPNSCHYNIYLYFTLYDNTLALLNSNNKLIFKQIIQNPSIHLIKQLASKYEKLSYIS